MLSEWPPIENLKDYYLNYYLIKVKQGDKYSKITPVEEKIIKYIKATATPDEWNNLSNIFSEVSKEISKRSFNIEQLYIEISNQVEEALIKNKYQKAWSYYDKYHEILPRKYYGHNLKEYLVDSHKRVFKELEIYLKRFDFDEVNKIYRKNMKIIKQSEYNDLIEPFKKQYKLKIFEEIQGQFELYDFESADRLYKKSKDLFPTLKYEELKKKYIRYALNQIERVLDEWNFKKADKIVGRLSGFPEHEYYPLKYEYIEKFIKENYKNTLPETLIAELADDLVDFSIDLNYDFSIENVDQFAKAHLKTKKLPSSFYRLLIEILVNDIKNGDMGDEKYLIETIVKKYLLNYPKKKLELSSLWVIFCSFPEILKNIIKENPSIVEILSMSYPFNDALKFIDFFFPKEKYILNKISYEIDFSNKSLCKRIKQSLKELKYYNALLLFVIIEANNNEDIMGIHDVFIVLKQIQDKIITYYLDEKKQIENMIFPPCESSEGKERFEISKVQNIFCEGREIALKEGLKVVMCRNRKCYERSEMLSKGAFVYDSIFSDILNNRISTPSNEAYGFGQFPVIMGEFNRWNERAERIFCGFGETPGCNSPLKSSIGNVSQVGFAAYAATFWRCPNEACKRHIQIIKLSHCRGCGKIIDSRFDKLRCPRDDEKEFYICNDCGSCCSQHTVSGICPNCGTSSWNNADDFGKIFRCKKCHHEIAIPSKYKNELNNYFLKFR